MCDCGGLQPLRDRHETRANARKRQISAFCGFLGQSSPASRRKASPRCIIGELVEAGAGRRGSTASPGWDCDQPAQAAGKSGVRTRREPAGCDLDRLAAGLNASPAAVKRGAGCQANHGRGQCRVAAFADCRPAARPGAGFAGDRHRLQRDAAASGVWPWNRSRASDRRGRASSTADGETFEIGQGRGNGRSAADGQSSGGGQGGVAAIMFAGQTQRRNQALRRRQESSPTQRGPGGQLAILGVEHRDPACVLQGQQMLLGGPIIVPAPVPVQVVGRAVDHDGQFDRAGRRRQRAS